MQGGSLKGAAGASALVPVEREFRWGDLINDFLNVSVDKPSQMRYHIANKFCGAVDVRRGSQLPQCGGASSARKPKSGEAVSFLNAAERPPRGNQSPAWQAAPPTRRSVPARKPKSGAAVSFPNAAERPREETKVRCGSQLPQHGGASSAGTRISGAEGRFPNAAERPPRGSTSRSRKSINKL